MDFRVNGGIWGTMFGIPAIVADNFLKLATGEQIKVLLYILRNSGNNCSEEIISANTGVPVQTVAEAVMFWQQVNVLSAENSVSAVNQGLGIMTPQNNHVPQQNVQQITAQTAPNNISVQPTNGKQNYSSSEVAKMMRESAELSELFKTAESIFGILNHTMQNSLIWMNSYLGLKAEVIITLISYCASIDKKGSGYIEKIAVSWSEKEINTLQLAQEEINRMRKSKDFEGQIVSMFGMNYRPTAKQTDFIKQWREIGFSTELIHYAYEKTMEQINKLSFEYINKILLSWRKSGYAKVSDVKAAEEEYRNGKSASKSSGGNDSFDVKRYEALINKF